MSSQESRCTCENKASRKSKVKDALKNMLRGSRSSTNSTGSQKCPVCDEDSKPQSPMPREGPSASYVDVSYVPNTESGESEEERSPGEIRVRTEVARYIWGQGNRPANEKALMNRIYSTLVLQKSPALVFLQQVRVEDAPAFVRGGLDEVISIQLRQCLDSSD
ncbi:hypothetical protein GGS21DRAFT_125991 [Xylaria nigripes]|nr:hypothetical protein GGS21DRAFT_125991 [Xylaria nigripes]